MTTARPTAGAAEGGALFPAPSRIRILPLAPEEPSSALLAWLASTLADRLGCRVEVGATESMHDSWWTEHRSQLLSNAVVDTLIDRHPLLGGTEATPGAGEWILAATAADLRGCSREYVFGEAALGGAWAVISIARFGAADSPLLHRRVLAEALHELGHLAGLEHCDGRRCLMAPAVDVSDVDRRGLTLCPACFARRPPAPDRP